MLLPDMCGVCTIGLSGDSALGVDAEFIAQKLITSTLTLTPLAVAGGAGGSTLSSGATVGTASCA